MKKGILMKLSKNNQSRKIGYILRTWAVTVGLLVMTALPAAAAEDAQKYNDVIINGYKLGFFEQVALEDFIDQEIEDGNYWFEMDTGMWGRVGEPPIGHIKVPDDYREYVESRMSNQNQAAQVELSSSKKDCGTGCVYW
ncbi:MAG: hypothetical protein OEZ51_09590 [Nitrospinota bacterium]|nr:hypothetical protein [Nitrospinota bacterium]